MADIEQLRKKVKELGIAASDAKSVFDQVDKYLDDLKKSKEKYDDVIEEKRKEYNDINASIKKAKDAFDDQKSVEMKQIAETKKAADKVLADANKKMVDADARLLDVAKKENELKGLQKELAEKESEINKKLATLSTLHEALK